MPDGKELDFAYKYPFSGAAKELISSYGNAIEMGYLRLAEVHVRDAAKRGKFEYAKTGMESLKKDYVIVYLYSRMLLSALKNNEIISKYSAAEARRSAEAIEKDGLSDLLKVCSELGVKVVRLGKEDPLSIGVFDFLKLAKGERGLELANQKLGDGLVYVDPKTALGLITVAIRERVLQGLPIDSKLLPKEVLDYSRSVKIESPVTAAGAQMRGGGWIDGLLEKPVMDGRHRIVNLVLAPYLVNVKKLEVDKAVAIIHEYIERCKKINPATDVNEQYIRYQCTYSKNKGLRPLSLRRARETFGDII
jgi:hypothetical protein